MYDFASIKKIVDNTPAVQIKAVIEELSTSQFYCEGVNKGSSFHKIEDIINVRNKYGQSLIFGCNLPEDKLIVLLQMGLDPNIVDNRGNVFIHIITDSNVVKILRILSDIEIKVKFNPNIRNKEGNTFLINWGSYDCVERFLQVKDKVSRNFSENFDINSRNKNGDTLLHQRTDVLIVKILLRCGADKTIKNNDGLTPYDIAYRNGRYDLAELLSSIMDYKEVIVAGLKKNIDFGLSVSLVRALDEATLLSLIRAGILDVNIKENGTNNTLMCFQNYEKKKFLVENGISTSQLHIFHDFKQLLHEAVFKVKFDPNQCVKTMSLDNIILCLEHTGENAIALDLVAHGADILKRATVVDKFHNKMVIMLMDRGVCCPDEIQAQIPLYAQMQVMKEKIDNISKLLKQ